MLSATVVLLASDFVIDTGRVTKSSSLCPFNKQCRTALHTALNKLQLVTVYKQEAVVSVCLAEKQYVK